MRKPCCKKRGDLGFKTLLVIILTVVLFLLMFMILNKMKNGLFN